MTDIWMDVDIAIANAPVNMLPLVDDTDFKAIEDAVAFNQAGLALFWHFVTPAGVKTVTAVTPTSAGDYDWTDDGTSGTYSIEIPASGGASINNNTEGVGWFTGIATGILPWRGPLIGFRAAGLNDALIESAYSATRGLSGTALPAAAADAAGGLAISDAGGLDLDAKLANTNEVTAARMAVLTDWINGGRLDLLLDAIPTTPMRGTDGANTVAPDNATISAIAGYLDTEIAAIKAKTDQLAFTVANQVDANAESWNAAAITSALEDSAAIADAVLDEVLAGHLTAGTLGRVVRDLNLGIIYGTAVTGTLSTTAMTTDLTGYADDELIGRVAVFTGGDADGQAAVITDYANASGLVTFTAGITTLPANNDPFKIV